MSISYDPYACEKQVEQLQAANARLRRMLELAAEKVIDTLSNYLHLEGQRYYPVLHMKALVEDYGTPIEALEAAFDALEAKEKPIEDECELNEYGN